MARNEAGYEMVSSFEDLLGRLVVASERQISKYNVPDEGIWILGLPYPSEATNEQLNRIEPLYVKLLQNASNEEEDCILDRLDESDCGLIVADCNPLVFEKNKKFGKKFGVYLEDHRRYHLSNTYLGGEIEVYLDDSKLRGMIIERQRTRDGVPGHKQDTPHEQLWVAVAGGPGSGRFGER